MDLDGGRKKSFGAFWCFRFVVLVFCQAFVELFTSGFAYVRPQC